MSAGLKPYPAYKDSGLEWLGQVPTHWEVRRLGAIGRLFKGNGGTKEDEVPTGVPCVRYGDIYTHHRFFVRESRACVPVERASDYTPVRYGDVLFAGSGETIEEIGKSVACLIESSACCGGDVIVFRPSVELDARFMGYATDSKRAVAQKSRMGRGITVMHIYADQLRNLWLAYPPLAEQAAIVRYLDYMDRRIRCYIRAKQKLVKLLDEQKQAIIHEAVTGQIDVRIGKPYPAYKDSGVEWLGQVPTHWNMRRLRNVVHMRVSNVDKNTVESEIPVRLCNYVDVYKNDCITEGMQFMRATASPDELRRFRLNRGDVLITKDSESWADIGVPALVEYAARDLVCGYHLAVLRPRQTVIDSGYLLRALQSRGVSHQLFVAANGVTRYGLSHSAIKSVWLPLPPPDEQAAIVRYLDDKAADTAGAIAHAQREIDLLREYRARLISDVVTGKLDVREAATNLPDEVEEPEELIEDELLAEENEVTPVEDDQVTLEEVET